MGFHHWVLIKLCIPSLSVTVYPLIFPGLPHPPHTHSPLVTSLHHPTKGNIIDRHSYFKFLITCLMESWKVVSAWVEMESGSLLHSLGSARPPAVSTERGCGEHTCLLSCRTPSYIHRFSLQNTCLLLYYMSPLSCGGVCGTHAVRPKCSLCS